MYTPMKLVYRVPIWGHAIQQSRLNPEEANVKQNNFSGNQIKRLLKLIKVKLIKERKCLHTNDPDESEAHKKNFEKKVI